MPVFTIFVDVSLIEAIVLQLSQTANRIIGYCFLFASHSNYGPVLYHFRDEAIYWSKITIFPYPCIRRSR